MKTKYKVVNPLESVPEEIEIIKTTTNQSDENAEDNFEFKNR